MRPAPAIRPAGAGGTAGGTVGGSVGGTIGGTIGGGVGSGAARRPRRQVEVPVKTRRRGDGAPPVDPRISARRIAVRRDAGRRRLRRALWLGVVVALIAGAAGLTRTPLLDLDTIDVRGATATVTPDQVRAVVAEAGLRPGQPLLTIDAGPAEAALEALPGIEDAEVRRHWPGSVTIELTERVPVATVAVTSGVALVGADGIVVAVEPGDVPAGGVPPAAGGLVAVDGPPTLAPGDRLDAPGLLAVAAALPAALRPLVTAVTAAPDGVNLRLAAGNAVVQLGPADQVAEKLAAVQTMLAQADTTCMAVLDVKVPAAPTITRRSSC